MVGALLLVVTMADETAAAGNADSSISAARSTVSIRLRCIGLTGNLTRGALPALTRRGGRRWKPRLPAVRCGCAARALLLPVLDAPTKSGAPTVLGMG